MTPETIVGVLALLGLAGFGVWSRFRGNGNWEKKFDKGIDLLQSINTNLELQGEKMSHLTSREDLQNIIDNKLNPVHTKLDKIIEG